MTSRAPLSLLFWKIGKCNKFNEKLEQRENNNEKGSDFLAVQLQMTSFVTFHSGL